MRLYGSANDPDPQMNPIHANDLKTGKDSCKWCRKKSRMAWTPRIVYLTIIPRARVGYEVIDSQRGAKRRVGYNHLISNKREWNNCFIKNHQQILLDFADFAWLEQPEGNLMDAISQVWYNGSYTIAAKPIKTLELHYTMI